MSLDDRIFIELETVGGDKIAFDPMEIREMIEQGDFLKITLRSGQVCQTQGSLWHMRQQCIYAVLRERKRIMGLKEW